AQSHICVVLFSMKFNEKHYKSVFDKVGDCIE
ncbi:MAG: hypothetical protein ACI9FJ_002129, partial [Alteromonadaceae bacterium]